MLNDYVIYVRSRTGIPKIRAFINTAQQLKLGLRSSLMLHLRSAYQPRFDSRTCTSVNRNSDKIIKLSNTFCRTAPTLRSYDVMHVLHQLLTGETLGLTSQSCPDQQLSRGCLNIDMTLNPKEEEEENASGLKHL